MTEVQTLLRSAYLAGPMRGIDDYNFPEFHKQAAWLRDMCWEVSSPAERDEEDGLVDPSDPSGWADKIGLAYFMQFDLAAVCSTDCVVLLNGWETSQGARLEAMVAVEVGHPVFEIKEFEVPDGALNRRARRLKSVDPERIAAEFIAGTVGWDGLPRLRLIERPDTSSAAVNEDSDRWGWDSTEDDLDYLPPLPPEDIAAVDPGILSDAEEFDPPVLRRSRFTPFRDLVLEDLTGTGMPSGAVAGEDGRWDMRSFDEPTGEGRLDPDVVTQAMRAFATGATRNVETDPDIHGFTSPLAIAMFARYMHENRTQKDGTLRDSDNWKKGIPLDSYIRSMRRHLQDLTLHDDGYADCSREDLYAALSGLFFNVQGYMHEVSKEDIEAEREEEREALVEEAVYIADLLNQEDFA